MTTCQDQIRALRASLDDRLAMIDEALKNRQIERNVLVQMCVDLDRILDSAAPEEEPGPSPPGRKPIQKTILDVLGGRPQGFHETMFPDEIMGMTGANAHAVNRVIARLQAADRIVLYNDAWFALAHDPRPKDEAA